jgi:hypothetical protein
MKAHQHVNLSPAFDDSSNSDVAKKEREAQSLRNYVQLYK